MHVNWVPTALLEESLNVTAGTTEPAVVKALAEMVQEPPVQVKGAVSPAAHVIVPLTAVDTALVIVPVTLAPVTTLVGVRVHVGVLVTYGHYKQERTCGRPNGQVGSRGWNGRMP